jgi:hypothetical protein
MVRYASNLHDVDMEEAQCVQCKVFLKDLAPIQPPMNVGYKLCEEVNCNSGRNDLLSVPNIYARKY